MDPVTMAMIMGGVGVAKSELFDRPREERQRKLQSEIARYSPWTNMQANPGAIQEANPLGSAMQGAMAGAQMGQAAKAAETQEKLMGSMSNYYDKQAAMSGATMMAPQSPWSYMGSPQNAPHPYAGPIRPYGG